MRRAFAFGLLGLFSFAASCGTSGTPQTPDDSGGSSSQGVGGSSAQAGKGSGGSAGNSIACSTGLSSCPKIAGFLEMICTDTKTDPKNCGTCGTMCASNQMCTNGACTCVAPLTGCNGACVNTMSDPMNCGGCGTVCGSGAPFCSQGMCSASCGNGLTPCGNSCTNTTNDPLNCGFCGNMCMGGQACNTGACGCPSGQTTCSGVCTDTMTSVANCGTCGHACTTGQSCSAGACVTSMSTGGAGGMGGSAGSGATGGSAGTGVVAGAGGSAGGPPIPPERMGCPITAGLIADFEEGTATPPTVVKNEDRTGEWEMFNDKVSTSETMTVESSGGTDACDKYALHVKGTGYTTWGAGFGFSLVGPATAPVPYNATAHSFTGIRFKAKLGSTADSKSPVRFNISTPWTESKDNPGGQCTATTASTNKAAADCYQHAGRFMPPGTGAGQLTSSFQTFTYCFDRDLYPLSLPSNLTTDQRNNIGSNMLKVQFQFNQGKDYSGAYTTMYPAFSKGLPFDMWIDDVEFFTGACPTMVASPSNGSPTKPFPQNAAVGSCMPATNAAALSGQIAQAYATWTKNFVQNDHIVAPEQQNHITSEAMGYGMIIAAAMGDKAAFDKFWGYVQTKLSGGLMNWREDGSGSASDADLDIAYALLMAGGQWGGSYASAGNTMAGNIASKDVSNSLITGGSQFAQANYNASYFSPAAMRKLTGLSGFVDANYTKVNANITHTVSGVPTDWASKTDGSPSDAGGANVTSEITDGTNGAMGYDAARVPFRLGLDKCLGGTNTTGLSAIVSYFAAKYDMGASIDLLKAGWYKAKDAPHPMAKDLQGSFIGPMGVAGQAMGNKAMHDRAFRTILDLLESGDFNHTYFPSTVGLITLLVMSGNFPAP